MVSRRAPPIVRALKETPVHRVSVADALSAAGLTAPATHVKSNTTNRDGSPCLRSIQQPTFTVTAAHPLQWANHDGKTIRCCTPAEQALLQTFPPTWAMPSGYRLSIHAAGNAIPPTLAAHIMRCAMATSEAAPSPPPPPPLALPPPPLPAVADAKQKAKAPTSAQLRALKRRVAALEKAVGLSRGASGKIDAEEEE